MRPEVFPDVRRLYSDEQIDTGRSRWWSTCWCGETPATTRSWPTRSSARAAPHDQGQRLHPHPKPGRLPAGRRAKRARARTSTAWRCWCTTMPPATRRRELLAGFSDAAAAGASPSTAAGHRRQPKQLRRSRLAAARSHGWTQTTSTCLARWPSGWRCWTDHPQVGLVHGGFDLIDSDGRPLRPWPPAHQRDVIQQRREAFDDLAASNPITTSTVVVRRSLHQAAGPFAASIGASSSDWDMWLRIALRCDVAYLAHPVARYRQHHASISSRTAASGERLRCDVRVVRHVLDQDRRLIADPRAARIGRQRCACRQGAGTRGRPAHRRPAARRAARGGARRPGWHRALIGGGALTLMAAVAAGDNYRSYRTTKQLLDVLAHHVGSSRYADRLSQLAAREPLYEEMTAPIVRPSCEVSPAATRWWRRRPSGIRRCCG